MAKRNDEQLWGLPETQTLENGMIRTELEALIREAHSLKDAETRLKEVKKRIVELVQQAGAASDVLGCRYQNYCTIVRWQDGRRTLNRELLIDNGVTPIQIEASMKQGDGSWICELPRIEG